MQACCVWNLGYHLQPQPEFIYSIYLCKQEKKGGWFFYLDDCELWYYGCETVSVLKFWFIQGISLKTTEMQDNAQTFSSMAKETLRVAEQKNSPSKTWYFLGFKDLLPLSIFLAVFWCHILILLWSVFIPTDQIGQFFFSYFVISCGVSCKYHTECKFSKYSK